MAEGGAVFGEMNFKCLDRGYLQNPELFGWFRGFLNAYYPESV
jgi:hypothetical protein